MKISLYPRAIPYYLLLMKNEATMKRELTGAAADRYRAECKAPADATVIAEIRSATMARVSVEKGLASYGEFRVNLRTGIATRN